MSENEFWLQDRIAKIKSVIEKYGGDQFEIPPIDGADIVNDLVNIAVPGNHIPRESCGRIPIKAGGQDEFRCLIRDGGRLLEFWPLGVLDKDWLDWYRERMHGRIEQG